MLRRRIPDRHPWRRLFSRCPPRPASTRRLCRDRRSPCRVLPSPASRRLQTSSRLRRWYSRHGPQIFPSCSQNTDIFRPPWHSHAPSVRFPCHNNISCHWHPYTSPSPWRPTLHQNGTSRRTVRPRP